VTCVRWIPHSGDLLLVAHASGQLYQYGRDLPGDSRTPSYQLLRSGDGFSVYTNKAKGALNPMIRWSIGDGACVHEIAFSPCGSHLATVGQDGFLRVFDYSTFELIGRFRSYFGGLLCVCWSPDGRLVATGGEDDLITVWSLDERRVLAKGRGHKSWVSIVAFDPYTCTTEDRTNLTDEDERLVCNGSNGNTDEVPLIEATIEKMKNVVLNEDDDLATSEATEATESSSSADRPVGSFYSYRLGSVGQDTNLCLWELSDEVLRRPVARSRTSMIQSLVNSSNAMSSVCNGHPTYMTASTLSAAPPPMSQSSSSSATAQSSAQSTLNHGNNGRSTAKKEHRRNFSLVSRSTDKQTLHKNTSSRLVDDPVKLLGTAVCPRLTEVPHLEPLVCKKIAHERLSALVFRPDCFVTGCYEGIVCTWARPGKWSPSTSVTDGPSEMADDLDSSVV
jgi:WD40 repeat protein